MLPKNSAHTIATRISSFLKPTIFEELTTLAVKTKSKNMAQGFPDWETPMFVKEALNKAAKANENQYIRCGGHLVLCEAIAKEYSKKFNREISATTEVSVANGATGILANAFCSFIEPGDEVIVFEPGFEFHYVDALIYGANVKFMAMGAPKENSNQWTIDFEKLESLFTEKTRMIVLNTPHNPTGKVLQPWECEKMVEILAKFPRVLVLADEVYEYMYYGDNKNTRIGSYPGMWERTLSIYSLGKTFSCTGWRVGFAIGDPALIKPLIAAQQWLNFNVNRPAQVALAEAMTKSVEPYEGKSSYYTYLEELFRTKKSDLMSILNNLPYKVRLLDPEGGFFVLVDISESIPTIPIRYFYKEGVSENDKPVGDDWRQLENPDYAPDFAFTRWMTFERGVSPIPLSTFYDNSGAKSVKDYKSVNFVRFAICKSDETMDAVRERLAKK